MAYNTKDLLTDLHGKPIPQVYEPNTDNYMPKTGENILKATRIGADQTTTWAASASINTLKKIDFTKPSVPVSQYMLTISNPSLVTNLNGNIYALEPSWGTLLETRPAKIGDSFTVAKSTGVVIEDCEDVWDSAQGANVVVAAEGTIKKVGTNSVKISPVDGATAGLLATEAITAVNLTKYTHIRFWIRSSIGVAANQLRLLLDDTAACASPLETLNVPALTAGVWSCVIVPLADPTLLTAVVSVGLSQVSDLGACDIYVDNVQAMAMSTESRIFTGLFNGTNLRLTLDNDIALGADDSFSSITRLRELI